MTDIDGNPLPLSNFKGKVIMVVNTASFCGNTPQYGGLQTLYKRYRDQGFTILAFLQTISANKSRATTKRLLNFAIQNILWNFRSSARSPFSEKANILSINISQSKQPLKEK